MNSLKSDPMRYYGSHQTRKKTVDRAKLNVKKELQSDMQVANSKASQIIHPKP